MESGCHILINNAKAAKNTLNKIIITIQKKNVKLIIVKYSENIFILANVFIFKRTIEKIIISNS